VILDVVCSIKRQGAWKPKSTVMYMTKARSGIGIYIDTNAMLSRLSKAEAKSPTKRHSA
jgi:hypothetical protein